MIEYEQMKELIRFLRMMGVTSYSTPQLSLILGEEPMLDVALDTAPKSRETRKGADGLTAEDQELLYGRTFDAG